jgi:hypothetical protein
VKALVFTGQAQDSFKCLLLSFPAIEQLLQKVLDGGWLM